MNLEGLRVTSFDASTAYLKQARFTSQLIPELIKAMSCVSDNYEKVEKLGDSGIRLSMEGEFSIDITRERFAYQETVKRSFQLVKDDFVSLLSEIKQCLQLTQIWGLTITIQAVCPVQPKIDVKDFLRTKVVAVKDNQIDQLNFKEFNGVGLRLYGKQDNGSYNIVIEPLFVDPSQFFINVGWSEGGWFETPSVMGNKLDMVYQMLTNQVTKFISSFD